MTPPDLSGPSAEAVSGRTRHLVVLLHGVRADGNDLFGLVPELAPLLPDAAFVSPDGPFAYDMAPFGRQWFSLRDRSPAAIAAGVRQAAPILNAFLDRQLAARGLDESALALVGFSQGTMMALHVAMRRPRPCAAVVGFSGRLVEPERLAEEIVSRPRTLLIHGDADDVVPPASLDLAARALAGVGVPVIAEMRPNLGHGIDLQGLRLAVNFLRQCLGGGGPD